jgi:hypothetical protein
VRPSFHRRITEESEKRGRAAEEEERERERQKRRKRDLEREKKKGEREKIYRSLTIAQLFPLCLSKAECVLSKAIDR